MKLLHANHPYVKKCLKEAEEKRMSHHKYYHFWHRETEHYEGIFIKEYLEPFDEDFVYERIEEPEEMPKIMRKDGWYVVLKGGQTTKFFKKVGEYAYCINEYGSLVFVNNWDRYEDHVIGSVAELCELEAIKEE